MMYNFNVLSLMISNLKDVLKELALDFIFYFEGLLLVQSYSVIYR